LEFIDQRAKTVILLLLEVLNGLVLLFLLLILVVGLDVIEPI
jgi:hypothetical protein